ARLVDQAVDGGGAGATLAAHHACRLAGEGRKQDLAVDTLGEVLGERRLARSGITACPRAALSQFETAVRAASWWGVKIGIGGKDDGPPIKNITRTFVKAYARCAARVVRACARLRASREEESYGRGRGDRNPETQRRRLDGRRSGV